METSWLKASGQFAVHLKGADMPVFLLEKFSKEITRNGATPLSISMSTAMEYIITEKSEPGDQ